MKAFSLNWLNGEKNIIWGSTIQEAIKNYGYGQGAMAALDFWEEISELPTEHRKVYADGEEVYNPEFINRMKTAIIDGLEVGNNIFIDFYKGFTFCYEGTNGLIFNFKIVK